MEKLEDAKLESLGIRLSDRDRVEEYYGKLKGVLLAESLTASHGGVVLDLSSLPTEPIPFKDIFVKWLIEINLGRIESGQKPIVTYELISKCPLWKTVRPPLKRVSLTKEGVFGNPKPGGKMIGSGKKYGSINKK